VRSAFLLILESSSSFYTTHRMEGAKDLGKEEILPNPEKGRALRPSDIKTLKFHRPGRNKKGGRAAEGKKIDGLARATEGKKRG